MLTATDVEYIRASFLTLDDLCALLMLPSLRGPDWRRDLREQVDELDALERDFAPDFDRGDERDRPPTRDLLIKAARQRYSEVFADAAGAAFSCR